MCHEESLCKNLHETSSQSHWMINQKRQQQAWLQPPWLQQVWPHMTLQQVQHGSTKENTGATVLPSSSDSTVFSAANW